MWPFTEERRPALRRTNWLIATGCAAAVVATATLVVLWRAAGDDASPVGVSGSASATPGAPSPAFTGQPGDEPPVTADAGAREAEVLLASASPRAVRYSFDAGPGRSVLDLGGQHALRTVTALGGTVSFVRRGDGYAARFPARCHAPDSQCARAILETTGADAFNSGTRPMRYGAAVLMTAADTAAGANVLQKGFSVGGGTQYKLQVDGRAGKPSCVLARGATIYRLVGPVGIADGRWHRVACTRAGGWLSINVDGVAVSRQVPAGLSIDNDQPLRIGGKNAAPGNDQYAGQIDDVFVSIY
ncbi:MAG TPA: LamG-like jellyroll fold domain-containing protein [Pilimelia sp.]|nr:LamG-like jellyroll fold domain-containing protein [Pilimelia sp.]